MQLNSFKKEILVLGLIILNPITLYWYWSFYANFYFFENMFYFVFASLILIFLMSVNIKTASIVSVFLRAFICGLLISLGQKLLGGVMDRGSLILLKESSVVTLLLDSIFMTLVMPFLVVAILGLFAIRRIERSEK